MRADNSSALALPHSVNAEQALLGAILIDPSMFGRISDLICADDFHEEIHRRIFDVAANLAAEGKTASPVTVMPFLGNHDLGQGMTTGRYIASLAADLGAGSLTAPDYARVIRELAHRRKIISISSDASDMARAVGFQVKPERIAAEMVAALDEIAAVGVAHTLKRIGIGAAGREALVDAIEKKEGKPSRGVMTGLPALDALVGSLERGHGSVLAGRPSMGKTAVAVCIAQTIAKAGYGVAYVSLEMGGVSLAQRALSCEVFDDFGSRPIPYTRIARGQISDAEVERITRASARLDRVPLMIEQQPNLMVSQITARVRQIKAQMNATGVDLALVIVDHLGLVGASNRYSGDRVREIGEISAGLHGLARESDTHVMMLSQLNRKVEERLDKRPQLADLRESGEIEQNADIVMGVFREAYYLERSASLEDLSRLPQVQNQIEIGVLKNRQGPTGTARLFADVASNAIRGLRD